jgi:renal tumor antigen
MKKKFDSIDKVRKLKEIQALNILSSHCNIITMIEALYDEPSGKLALVFELMDMNLYECLKNKKNPLTFHRIKYIMFQVLRSIDFMHRKGIFHRDIKP